MIGEDTLLRFSGVPLGEACTVVIRGATQQIIDEAERSLHDALCVLASTVRESKIVYGGGCSEMLMACAVMRAAAATPGKEAVAMEAFARALQQLPTVIADNAGYDSAQLISELRAAHNSNAYTMGLGKSFYIFYIIIIYTEFNENQSVYNGRKVEIALRAGHPLAANGCGMKGSGMHETDEFSSGPILFFYLYIYKVFNSLVLVFSFLYKVTFIKYSVLRLYRHGTGQNQLHEAIGDHRILGSKKTSSCKCSRSSRNDITCR